MKNIIKKAKFKLETTVLLVGTLLVSEPVLAADPQGKLQDAGNTIKGILTGLIVIVGGIAWPRARPPSRSQTARCAARAGAAACAGWPSARPGAGRSTPGPPGGAAARSGGA